MIEALLFVSVFAAAGPSAPPQDPSADLRREARRSAYRYESLLRRRAPARFGGGAGTDCDEIIGRFCFRFTDGAPTAADTMPEDSSIVEARSRAIWAYRAWLAVAPHSADAAGPLVRYLVESNRAGEAVALARTHAWAADRNPGSLLLLGLALHESGAFAEAEAVFDSARAALPEAERRRLDAVGVLLEPAERSRYGRLSQEEREAYNGRFWRFSDPSLLEPGNERRSAHYARHAWAAILAEAPHAAGRPSWRTDTEEILLRYGLPTRRERLRQPPWRLERELSMLEVFDPHAVSFVPEVMGTRGLGATPDPGARPPLERDTVRSSYAPVSLHRMQGLAVQVARFPTRAGAVLAVTGRLAADTAVPPPASPAGLLVVLDTLGREVARSPARVRVGADSVTWLSAEVGVGPGAWVYRLEVKDDSTGRGGLAQYRIDVEAPDRPALSDPLVAAARKDLPSSRGELVPLAGPVLPPDASVLIWAELTGLTRRAGEGRYSVEWWVESADRRTALGRVARWIGRRMGLIGDDEAVRVRWESRSVEDPVPLTFGVDFAGLEPGLYRLGLTARDLVSGRAATATRLVRLDPSAPSPPSRPPD